MPDTTPCIVYRAIDGSGAIRHTYLGLALEVPAKPVAVVCESYVLLLEVANDVIAYTQKLTRIVSEEWLSAQANTQIVYEQPIGGDRFALVARDIGKVIILRLCILVGIIVHLERRWDFLSVQGRTHTFGQVEAFMLMALFPEHATA